MRLGLFLLISSALVCVAYLFVTEDNWYIVMLAADGIQVVLLLATIVPIERALQKNFDSNGTKRTSEVK